jgi:hypothetical protein
MYKRPFLLLAVSALALCQPSHATSKMSLQKDDSWIDMRTKKLLKGSETVRYRLCGEGDEPFYPYPITGASGIEDKTRWTNGKKIVFTLPRMHTLGQIVGITLPDTTGYSVTKNKQKVMVSGEGIAQREYLYDPTSKNSIQIAFSDELKEQIRVIFEIPYAASCAGDPRLLGIRIPHIDIHLYRFLPAPVEKVAFRLATTGEEAPLPQVIELLTPIDREELHAWTRGKNSRIKLPLNLTGGRVTSVEFQNAKALVSTDRPQTVTMRIGDAERVYQYNVDTPMQDLFMEIPRSLPDVAEMVIDTPHACPPGQINPEWAGDPRDLGLSINLVKLGLSKLDKQPIERIRYRLAAKGDVPSLPPEIQFTGLSDSEETHRWTQGKVGSFKIPLRINEGYVIGVRFPNTCGFISKTLTQRLIVKMNGGVEMQYKYDEEHPIHSPEIVFTESVNGFAEVQLEMPDASRPGVVYPDNGDPRELAILMNIVELIVRKVGVALPPIGDERSVHEKFEDSRKKALADEAKKRHDLRLKKRAEFIAKNLLLFPEADRAEATNNLEKLCALFPEISSAGEQQMTDIKMAASSANDVMSKVSHKKEGERLNRLTRWINDHADRLERIKKADEQALRTQALYKQIPGIEPVLLTGDPDGYMHASGDTVNIADEQFKAVQRFRDREGGQRFEIVELPKQTFVLVKAVNLYGDEYHSYLAQDPRVYRWYPKQVYPNRAHFLHVLTERLRDCQFFKFGEYLWGVSEKSTDPLRYLTRQSGYEIAGPIMGYLGKSHQMVYDIRNGYANNK